MTQERKVELLLVKDGKAKTVESAQVKFYDDNATVANLKETGFTKLFDADKYVKDKEEVKGTSYKEITDETLISSDKALKYFLYVTAK